jgi:hypothetical protein
MASSSAVRGTPSVAELDAEAANIEEEDVGAEAAGAPAGEATRRARSAWLKRRVIRIAWMRASIVLGGCALERGRRSGTRG